jgi:hypothetical protein
MIPDYRIFQVSAASVIGAIASCVHPSAHIYIAALCQDAGVAQG